MKKLLFICALSGLTLAARGQTNTNVIVGRVFPLTQTNAIPFVAGPRYGMTTNNNQGAGYVLQSGSATSQPDWVDSMKLTSVSNLYFQAYSNTLTTNFNVIFGDTITNTLYFTNGLLRNITRY